MIQIAVVVACIVSVRTIDADPCGMVPPIYVGDGAPIARVGDQNTFVFFKDGVETFVIRPAFEGKVDEFGMLIPFPAMPELRKAFRAAIDPPEVVIDVRPIPLPQAAAGSDHQPRDTNRQRHTPACPRCR